MREAEALARLRLSRSEGIGSIEFRRLLARHGSAEAALDALPARGLRPAEAGATRREMEAVLRRGGTFLHLGAPGYPELLALLADAPPVLAVLGDPALLAARQVAVVGARNASSAGRRIAEEMAEGLAAGGIVVTSGLARGIDTAAHLGALRAGRTVAVLAGGLDIAYPPENAALQDRIAEAGALVAESPLGTAPIARHFPRRNRIVAGLSLGTVVVEAALRSGTLITARLATEAGREVYAVPGSPLDPRCQGSNNLLREGATFTETAEDVLSTLPAAPLALPPRPGRAPAPRNESPTFLPAEHSGPRGETDQLLELIGYSPVTVDEVLRRCHLSPSAAQSLLLDLELSGRVELLPGNRIVRAAVAARED
ncbi:DNA-processing protein DprA [Roseomonas sp. OT10]|uniref:DNA-processing protein DprA n=1 Tax=Roseomonas cutis TaxID=2897332 RepID=UPI001E3630BD|nr:DNA-processing protein DprA [Roseomonas sp. OT10]UFN51038.1 DNA-processing protein DprA [Roseomonas sp. OT10]